MKSVELDSLQLELRKLKLKKGVCGIPTFGEKSNPTRPSTPNAKRFKELLKHLQYF
jgi:hypothetical protein